jgi:hypothetical protein
MRRLPVAAAMFLLLVGACKPQLFPPKATEGVDPHFDFSRWRIFPNQFQDHKIQLGGLILQSDTKIDIKTPSQSWQSNFPSGKDIADFGYSGAGYESLREETYCETLPY